MYTEGDRGSIIGEILNDLVQSQQKISVAFKPFVCLVLYQNIESVE